MTMRRTRRLMQLASTLWFVLRVVLVLGLALIAMAGLLVLVVVASEHLDRVGLGTVATTLFVSVILVGMTAMLLPAVPIRQCPAERLPRAEGEYEHVLTPVRREKVKPDVIRPISVITHRITSIGLVVCAGCMLVTVLLYVGIKGCVILLLSGQTAVVIYVLSNLCLFLLNGERGDRRPLPLNWPDSGPYRCRHH